MKKQILYENVYLAKLDVSGNGRDIALGFNDYKGEPLSPIHCQDTIRLEYANNFDSDSGFLCEVSEVIAWEIDSEREVNELLQRKNHPFYQSCDQIPLYWICIGSGEVFVELLCRSFAIEI